MNAFEYASPTTKEQAVKLLGNSWADAEVLAGGTDLISLMKDYVVTPKRLVNIKNIKELRGVSWSAKAGLRIGAIVTIQELLDSPQLREYKAITQAGEGIASPQLRAMGTVGGELCQRPRCWYYRAGFGILAKDEKGEPLVPNGDNRYHAILGNNGEALFVNPSSLAPALIAMNAKVRIFGAKGQREVALENFFVTPKSDGDREYDLKPGEMVTDIIVPPMAGAKSATYEVRQKDSLDWPLATASVVLTMTGNKVKAARIVLGHVAPTPYRSMDAEKALVGQAITEESAEAAGKAAVAQAKALSKNGYKIQLAKVAVKRAILAAAKGGMR
ncbi:MAG: FAD binding domain-containing protein [Acidobacteriota bacterium]